VNNLESNLAHQPLDQPNIRRFPTKVCYGCLLFECISSNQPRVALPSVGNEPDFVLSLGVLERAKKDEEISEPVLSKAKKIVYVAGVAYVQNEA
jgi:hypothetical protein